MGRIYEKVAEAPPKKPRPDFDATVGRHPTAYNGSGAVFCRELIGGKYLQVFSKLRKIKSSYAKGRVFEEATLDMVHGTPGKTRYFFRITKVRKNKYKFTRLNETEIRNCVGHWFRDILAKREVHPTPVAAAPALRVARAVGSAFALQRGVLDREVATAPAPILTDGFQRGPTAPCESSPTRETAIPSKKQASIYSTANACRSVICLGTVEVRSEPTEMAVEVLQNSVPFLDPIPVPRKTESVTMEDPTVVGFSDTVTAFGETSMPQHHADSAMSLLAVALCGCDEAELLRPCEDSNELRYCLGHVELLTGPDLTEVFEEQE